jgi:hypothetical protein
MNNRNFVRNHAILEGIVFKEYTIEWRYRIFIDKQATTIIATQETDFDLECFQILQKLGCTESEIAKIGDMKTDLKNLDLLNKRVIVDTCKRDIYDQFLTLQAILISTA